MYQYSKYIKLFDFNSYFISSLIAPALGFAGQLLTNKSNAKQADDQQDFQAEMSNTAYQRSMADMKKAGLNPILASKTGGASTPTGAMAQMQNPVTSAFQGAQTQADVNLKNANEALTKTKDVLSKTLVPGAQSLSIITSAVKDIVQSLDSMLKSKTGGYDKIIGNATQGFKDLMSKAKGMGAETYQQVQKYLQQKFKDVGEGTRDLINSYAPPLHPIRALVK